MSQRSLIEMAPELLLKSWADCSIERGAARKIRTTVSETGVIGPRCGDIDLSIPTEATLLNVTQEPVNLQFRWDVCNAINTTSVLPIVFVSPPIVGKLTFAKDPRRMQVAPK